MKTIQRFTVIASMLALAACGGSSPTPPQAGGAVGGCSTRAYAEIGGPFNLTDHNGNRVTEADFMGRASLVFFGFTYCPDICPGTLIAVNQAYSRLPEGVTPPQTLLITVDPERDTPEALATYVNADVFPEGLVGLTGSAEEISAAAEGFIAQYEKIETPASLAEYTMDHTSLLYLMDEDWQLQTFFAEEGGDPQYMADCLAEHLS